MYWAAQEERCPFLLVFWATDSICISASRVSSGSLHAANYDFTALHGAPVTAMECWRSAVT